MKERIGRACGRHLRDFGRLDQPWPTICTFHSLCLRILRHFAVDLGLASNFSIFDSSDQSKLLKEAIKLLELSATNFPPAAVHAAISKAKNHLVTADTYAGNALGFFEKNVARVYAKYQKLLEANNALDFDDLLLRAAHAMRDHPEILGALQDRFPYLLIDEYQDTNHAQYVLAHALAMRDRNICVVGDPDQSIYAWRGADIQNILDFEKDYPDAHIVRLEQNYRSTKTILHVASTLIARNTQRKEKALWTENDQGDRARVFLCQDEHDEAAIVAEQLRQLHDQHAYDWSQMAIFYRMNALSRVMEDSLRRAMIPYQIARGVEFYNRKEIKDVLAYLRVLVNPLDEVARDRIVNVPPRGIGDGSIRTMQAWSDSNRTTLWEAMERAGEITSLTRRAQNATLQFVNVINELRRQAEVSGSVQRIMESTIKLSGLETMLTKLDPDKENEIANVNELISAAAEYDQAHPEGGTLAEYLSAIALVSDADHLKESGGAVTLMTLHAAKGLEVPVVCIIGMEEGVLPHSRAQGNLLELEEERRLCFVGITRAQQRLMLSKAAYRTIRGLRERTVTSPFLAEMPEESLQVIDRTGVRDLDIDDRQEQRRRLHEEADHLAQQFRKGQLVKHPTFGLGRIAEVSQNGQQTRAVVLFNAAGRKTLILEYANLEPVT
jgi:DNA helicase-2/ATP-dependent DNA helicase PcrA